MMSIFLLLGLLLRGVIVCYSCEDEDLAHVLSSCARLKERGLSLLSISFT